MTWQTKWAQVNKPRSTCDEHFDHDKGTMNLKLIKPEYEKIILYEVVMKPNPLIAVIGPLTYYQKYKISHSRILTDRVETRTRGKYLDNVFFFIKPKLVKEKGNRRSTEKDYWTL